MPIITPSKIVKDALDEFLAPLFENTPQRNHLANYTVNGYKLVFSSLHPLRNSLRPLR